MLPLRDHPFFAVAIVLIGLSLPVFGQQSGTSRSAEQLLVDAGVKLRTGPEAAKDELQQLSKIEDSLTPLQQGTYLKMLSSSYAFRGMYKEQVENSQKALKIIRDIDPDLRASVLYLLADGYSSLGQYENALTSMSESIQLLPKLNNLIAKVDVLQSAYSLLEQMGAYDEALSYADRLDGLSPNGAGSLPTCLAAADRAEVAFTRHDSANFQALADRAISECDSDYKVIVLSVRALDSIEKLNVASDAKALDDSLKMFAELSKVNDRSDYSVLLANAIAKRFLQSGQPVLAEQYAEKAMLWANSGNAIRLRQQTNETMSMVMRAEGKLDQALSYLKVSNNLWTQLLEERSGKDLAYQRMKFRAQDQSVQLKLLGQINQLLTTEHELQERNKHILELLVGVTGVLLALVLFWGIRTWRQKNDFRTYSQIDGLTKISNRTHFIACAHQAFKDARGSISIVLFDMDEFKLINDTYSHAAGDWVLKMVSATIASCLRSQDLFGRLGGEEFAICLPHTSEADATALAERCRVAIESIDSSSSGHQFSLSASFGIAVRPPNGSVGFEEVLAAADRALYQAKHLGRNRIAPYGEVIGHAPLVA